MCNAETITGAWYYSARQAHVIDAIFDGGWRPDLIGNTMYGTAIYLARTNWYGDRAAPEIIACELHVLPEEAMHEFTSSPMGGGNTGRHLREYWRDRGVPCFKTPQKGTDSANVKRRAHFMDDGIKAITFEEYTGVIVAAVYDTSVIVNMQRIAREEVPPCPVPCL